MPEPPGTLILVNEVHPLNTFVLLGFKLELYSKVIVFNDEHPEKQLLISIFLLLELESIVISVKLEQPSKVPMREVALYAQSISSVVLSPV